jgi:uncharacterized protein
VKVVRLLARNPCRIRCVQTSQRWREGELLPQLGCNLSEPLLALLREERVRVDWIKLSRWEVLNEELAVARPLRPVLLHTLPHAGLADPGTLPWSWDQLRRHIAACGSPHVALHLLAEPADFAEPPGDRQVADRMITMTRLWKEHLPVPLLVENVPFNSKLIPVSTDPGLVAEVCAATGAGLLLDLAHARVAAWHRGQEVREYVRALPLPLVREIHVCGPGYDPVGGLRDRHLQMQEEDYALLEWALERTDPLVVTLEYGGTGPKFAHRSDPALLREQLLRLARLCSV